MPLSASDGSPAFKTTLQESTEPTQPQPELSGVSSGRTAKPASTDKSIPSDDVGILGNLFKPITQRLIKIIDGGSLLNINKIGGMSVKQALKEGLVDPLSSAVKTYRDNSIKQTEELKALDERSAETLEDVQLSLQHINSRIELL